MKNYQAPQNLLQDRVILVTGAGQSIGRTAALTFASRGATVILHGRKVEKLEAVYDEIEAAGFPQAAIFPLDLYSAEDRDFEALATGIRRQFARLDGILHNASHFASLRSLEEHTLEQWQVSLRVNLMAPFALTRACLPLLKASPDASIIMTSETHGHVPAAYWGSFAVSKAAGEVLVKMWAQELELHPNLRINGIVPGPVQSTQRVRTHPGELVESMPLPESLMPQYLYLMGGDSRGVSGQIIEC
ncbi:MAG: YciK family oxidoreductase [Pseudomonadota bacterium]|nr:YciK family oxidoreductase [Gammaproteobacteria bacterium]MBU1731942.1 YciK family oxidoreductase [Gammaproteobacteria bacterium]MBU1893080.1 YciK family oxidoreductase [Gammaproteobacteria bacterium]